VRNSTASHTLSMRSIATLYRLTPTHSQLRSTFSYARTFTHVRLLAGRKPCYCHLHHRVLARPAALAKPQTHWARRGAQLHPAAAAGSWRWPHTTITGW
jgi:hypothetical protein